MPFPYIFISTYWLIFFGVLAYRYKKTVGKSISFNLAFLALFLGILEGYSYFALNSAENTRYEGDYKDGHSVPDEILGYGPVKGRAITSRKIFAGNSRKELLYDVSYTIDDSGLRVSSSEANDSGQCVLFFGGSFTFGEGVNDNETMPYFVQKLSSYQAYNFGYHGYGPHQMLSAIQHGMVETIIDCHPKAFIYQALLSHIARSNGSASWDHHGPKYILKSDGSLSYAGHFDDWMSRRLMDVFLKSFTYKNFIGNRLHIDEYDVELFVAIIDYSRDLLEKRYPNARFHVILWDNRDHKFNKTVIDGLKINNINLHLINQILTDYSTNEPQYALSSYDHHPNPFAHRRIAEYVVNKILSEH